MTDSEKETFRQIGIGLINEYRVRGGFKPIDWLAINTPETDAFIRSIQLHEKTKQELADCKQELADFRQEVSDVVKAYNNCDSEWESEALWPTFESFIIPSPKTDPLVDVLLEIQISSDLQESQHDAIEIRKALDSLGFEIREKNDG